ncbi:MAG TPA: hypothetical protein VLA56_20775 [Pseudomonadales bacterium]|nr:hypothetical protein [Pseudomonadales bacterium]
MRALSDDGRQLTRALRQTFRGGIPAPSGDPHRPLAHPPPGSHPRRSISTRLTPAARARRHATCTPRTQPRQRCDLELRRGWRRTLAAITDRPIGLGEHTLLCRVSQDVEANVLTLAAAGMSEPGDARCHALPARLRALEAIMARFSEQTMELALLPVGRHLGTRDRALRHLLARNHGNTQVLTLDADGDDVASQKKTRAG